MQKNSTEAALAGDGQGNWWQSQKRLCDTVPYRKQKSQAVEVFSLNTHQDLRSRHHNDFHPKHGRQEFKPMADPNLNLASELSSSYPNSIPEITDRKPTTLGTSFSVLGASKQA